MDDQHPGAQRKLRRNPFRYFPAYLLAACFLLFLFAFLQSNLAALRLKDTAFGDSALWELSLLDVKAALTVLITVLSLLYARNQFEYGLRPLLDYRIQRTAKSIYNLGSGSDRNSYMAVKLANPGGGVAIARRVQYTLTTKDKSALDKLSFIELTDQLKKLSLLQHEDYDLTNISRGWMLGPNEERTILELNLSNQDKKSKIELIERLDIHVEFEGLLKDAYAKDIYCIPRRGIARL